MTEKGIRRARIVPAIPESIGWGVGLAVVAACVSGLAIWLNAFAVKQVPDAAVYTTLKNGVAAVVLLAVAAPLVRRSDVRQVQRTGWVGLTIVGIVGGGIAFLLFFSGLAMASAPSAAFIQKTMFVWVAILAVPLLSERLGFVQIAALVALAVGQALVLPPRGVAWGPGETMILIATLLWAVEVVIVRRVLRAVPTPIVATGRLGIGLVVLVGYILFTGRIGGLLALAPEAWAWILLTGLILAGYVAAWFAALRRAPATIVTSVLVGGAVITGALQSLARGGPPTVDLVGGYVLIAAAVGVTALLALRTRPIAGQSSNATRVGTTDA
ncbi:MAG TPA: DMT family transporter [Candidatus Limnocylindrales bacterium]